MEGTKFYFKFTQELLWALQDLWSFFSCDPLTLMLQSSCESIRFPSSPQCSMWNLLFEENKIQASLSSWNYFCYSLDLSYLVLSYWVGFCDASVHAKRRIDFSGHLLLLLHGLQIHNWGVGVLQSEGYTMRMEEITEIGTFLCLRESTIWFKPLSAVQIIFFQPLWRDSGFSR